MYQKTEEGEVGQLVTRGLNLMTGYVDNNEATAKALHSPKKHHAAQEDNQTITITNTTSTESDTSLLDNLKWYVNLGDICFWLRHYEDGGKDIYWVSRDSNLLIRGGANYSYDQVHR